MPTPPALNITAIEMEKALTAYGKLVNRQTLRIADLESEVESYMETAENDPDDGTGKKRKSNN